MIIPEYIKKDDVIGVSALSDGVSKDVDKIRFENGKKNLEEKSYQVKFTNNVFTADEKGRSSSGEIRGEELNSLISDKDVKAIISAKGGNYLMEMLPFVNFENLKENPKWIQGYSDNTSILLAITTKLDIQTAYGCNFGDFGMGEWEKSVERNLEILEGKTNIQKSFEFYEDGFHDRITGLEGYSKDQPVFWKNLRNEKETRVKGRMIGGCLDVILNITGTKYDGVLEFSEKYKEDGILFYFETFDMGSEDLVMGLWHLKELGWFKYASGIVFGRPLMYSTFTETTFEEAVESILGELNIPIILDADIGHKGPQFVVLNGAIGEFYSKDGKGELKTF